MLGFGKGQDGAYAEGGVHFGRSRKSLSGIYAKDSMQCRWLGMMRGAKTGSSTGFSS